MDVACGDRACLTCEGIDIVVGSLRQQVLGLEVFTAFGIDPSDRRLLVVKSLNHFYAAFAPIAAEVIYMSAPGLLNLDLTSLPCKHAEPHLFPWVDDPWEMPNQISWAE